MSKIRWENRYNRNYNHEEIKLSDSLKNYIHSICNVNKKILDHGCGSGRVSKILMSECNSFIYYNDISDIAVDSLENFFTLYGYNNQKKIQGNIAEYTGENFDHIISHRVLHSCLNYMDILNKFYEKLNETIFISTRSDQCIDCAVKPFIKCFSQVELENILKNIGFKIIESGDFIELSARRRKENRYIYFVAQK
jgi:2-polyprenyl-3-methyl-5-hydroxy-6-metoxy-1,4-benzoquinol methylase